MKRCSRCKFEKTFEEFSKSICRKDGYQRECKKCRKIISQNQYLKNKEYYITKSVIAKKLYKDWWFEFKSKLNCEECGENKHWRLCFHHLDPLEKDTEVSQLISQGKSKQRVLKEISKCKVLCHNCHADVHYYEKETNIN